MARPNSFDAFFKRFLSYARHTSEATGIPASAILVAALRSCSRCRSDAFKEHGTVFLLQPGEGWEGPTFKKKLIGHRDGFFVQQMKTFRDYQGDIQKNFDDFGAWLAAKRPDLVGATDVYKICVNLSRAHIPPREAIAPGEFKKLYNDYNITQYDILPPTEG